MYRVPIEDCHGDLRHEYVLVVPGSSFQFRRSWLLRLRPKTTRSNPDGLRHRFDGLSIFRFKYHPDGLDRCYSRCNPDFLPYLDRATIPSCSGRLCRGSSEGIYNGSTQVPNPSAFRKIACASPAVTSPFPLQSAAHSSR